MAVQVADSGYLVAKFESPCATCGKTIETGCSMFPASDCIKGDARYHHLACALEIYKTMDALLASAPVRGNGWGGLKGLAAVVGIWLDRRIWAPPTAGHEDCDTVC